MENNTQMKQADIYETNLMRRLAGYYTLTVRLWGVLKKKLKENTDDLYCKRKMYQM